MKTHDQTEPEFSSDSITLSIAENAGVGDDVGKVAADDDDNDTQYYSMSGTGASDFSLGQYNGTIDVAKGLDYETTSSYTLTLSVKDKKASDDTADDVVDDTITVTINVTDVNEPPPELGTPTVTKNSATPTTKLDVSWTAPTTTEMTGKPAVSDYDVQYRQTGVSTWTDASFTGTGTSTTLTGLTSGKTYEVQVRAVNHEGDGAWSDSGTAITTAGGVTRSVAENSSAGTNVGAAVTAKSTNTTYDYTHALSGTDASKFEIGSSTGQITVKSGTSLDYEAKTSYSVIVTVTAAAKTQGANAQSVDPNAPGDYVIPVTINVTDVNEPPTITAPTVSAHATAPKYKLEVSWTAPTMTGKPAVSDYDVQYKKSSESTWTSHSFTGTGTSTTLTGLTAGTTYDVQVKAINDEGEQRLVVFRVEEDCGERGAGNCGHGDSEHRGELVGGHVHRGGGVGDGRGRRHAYLLADGNGREQVQHRLRHGADNGEDGEHPELRGQDFLQRDGERNGREERAGRDGQYGR